MSPLIPMILSEHGCLGIAFTIITGEKVKMTQEIWTCFFVL
jgi:hypothetical protein